MWVQKRQTIHRTRGEHCMKTTTANKLTDEDYQLSEVNQLGTLLAVYRRKPGDIRFLHITGLLSCILGVVGLALVISLGFKNWHQLQTSNYLDFFPPLLLSLFALFRGGVLWHIEVQRAQTARVIVCEHGLLKVSRKIRSNRVEAVRWQEIVKIRRAFIGEAFAYAIAYRGGGTLSQLTLTGDYQNLDELVVLITERREKFYHTERMNRRSVVAKLQGGMKYRCPCCGYKTLNVRGGYEICEVCFWEDDGQDDVDANTDRLLGPNHMSLARGKENYLKFGATQKRAVAFVRPLLPEEM